MNPHIETEGRALVIGGAHPGIIKFPIVARFIDEPGLPCDVVLRIDADPGSPRLDVKESTLIARPGKPIVPAMYRQVPLASLRDAAIEAASIAAEMGPDGKLRVSPDGLGQLLTH
jgi:hypothetical protein